MSNAEKKLLAPVALSTLIFIKFECLKALERISEAGFTNLELV